MNYFLGIDIGTTSTKAVAFSDSGEVIASESIAYNMHHPQPGWSEQNPNEILQAVVTGINKVVTRLSPYVPRLVSFSAAMHSIMAVDANGNPLSPCIIWADNRANEIAENLRQTETGFRIYHSTGVPIHPMSPFCKLLWWKEHDPILFKSAFRFIGIKEYIFIKLFDAWLVDTSIASATGLLNIKTLQWDHEVLNFAGIETGRLSEVVSTRHFLRYKRTEANLLLAQDTPVVAGASDGALSNLGSGATGSNRMAITIGTSGAARLIVNDPLTDTRMRTFCYHVTESEYILGGATNNGAVVLQWLKETLMQSAESFEEFYKHAESVVPGSEGLLFLPYILGERAPIWNSNAKGVYFGLGIHHSKAHMIRASMEGVVFCLYSIGKILAEGREITELYASGGFARSALWLQVLSDVFYIKVLVSGSIESSALGAVMVGAEALGIPHRFEKKILSSHEPDKARHMIYMKCFEKFERLYELLKTEMK